MVIQRILVGANHLGSKHRDSQILRRGEISEDIWDIFNRMYLEGYKNKHHANGYCKFHNGRKILGIQFSQEKQIKDSSRGCLIFDVIENIIVKDIVLSIIIQFQTQDRGITEIYIYKLQ